jgi:hypothetical protein
LIWDKIGREIRSRTGDTIFSKKSVAIVPSLPYYIYIY